MGIENLESRRLFALVSPTPTEQYFVELLNRARANPAQFAIDFGLSVPLTDASPRPPLAINGLLTDSARGHAVEMGNFNYFAHQSEVTGKWPNRMARDAGYVLPAFWSDNANFIESISWNSGDSFREALGPLSSLLVDSFDPVNVGHRKHLLGMDAFNAAFEEIGVGYARNDASNFKNIWAIQTGVNENVAGKFLTGVAFNDSVVADNRYNVGEQLGGVTITARRTSDNAVFTTTTFGSGGYSLRLLPGTYDLTASGPGFATPVTYPGIVMGTENLKVDFRPAFAVPPALVGSDFNVNTRTLSYYFNDAIAPASASVGDLQVTNLTTGETNFVPTSVFASSSTLTFTLPTTLTDGNYLFRVPGGSISGTNGGVITANSDVFNQFVLIGDATRDRAVGFADLLVLAANYNQQNRAFQQGDFNYDNKVTFDDLLLMASRYNKTLNAASSAPLLAPPPPQTGGTPSADFASGRSDDSDELLN
jgi:uncharacterized protein YkwD